MSAEPQAVLTSTRGVPVPLQGVTAHGTLNGLLYELTVEQRYHNAGKKNLEAVFTFPLPLRAVLLGFDLEIGERKLSAVAIARQEASERYEKAIDEGDTAALIEHDGNGLYTVSLGNLLAGETAVIRYRYAELLDAHDGHVRLNVPTVIAPRYGNPADAGLEGPTVPGVDVLGEYPFAITLDLIGLTDPRTLRSPSHKITAVTGEGGLTVTMSRPGFLDRDFVLEIDAAAMPKHSLVAPDGDGYVMLTSTTLALDTQEQRPLTLKILLDCSGSMGGDSIAAAKRALLSILDRLTPQDRVSLTRFGSSVHHMTEGLEPADEHTLPALKLLVRRTDADLGGTEMKAALEATLAIPTPPATKPDLILITDGEIYDVESIVGLAARAGHRLFAIAIGAAPNEALARALSEKTGGACEFVGPTEDAEAAILRTFKRLRSMPRTLATIDWPMVPAWTAPLPMAVFPGDTLHLFAGFTAKPDSETVLTVRDAVGQGTAIHVPTNVTLMTGDLIPRLAAARRLATLAEAEARDLAVKYQLATEHTSFVVVVERADGEKATDLPATVAVPHMLAAGWGGSARSRTMRDMATPKLSMACYNVPSRSRHRFDIPSVADDLSDEMILSTVSFESAERDALIHSLYEAFQHRREMPRTLNDLAVAHPVPEGVLDMLRNTCIESLADEDKVIAAFLAWLEAHTETSMLSPDFTAMLRGGVVGVRGFRQLRKFMNESFEP